MDHLIDRLYYVLENPIVTPACLISNIKLPEYQTLTFHKEAQGLLAVMQCKVDGQIMEFRYLFDRQDCLSRAILINHSSSEEQVLFDRTEEVEQMGKRLIMSRNAKQDVTAV